MPGWGVTRTGQRGRWGSQAAQTLIEFAIILLVFMLIIVGIVDLSRAVYARNVVTSAAREAARYGVTHPADAAAIEAVARRVTDASRLDGHLVLVGVTRPDGVNVQVEVTYMFRPVAMLVAQYLPPGSPGIALRGRSLMRAE